MMMAQYVKFRRLIFTFHQKGKVFVQGIMSIQLIYTFITSNYKYNLTTHSLTVTLIYKIFRYYYDANVMTKFISYIIDYNAGVLPDRKVSIG